MQNSIIYKIAPRTLWHTAKNEGVFTGAPIDLTDGFIHFSTAAQVRATAAKHFAGQDNLLLLSVDAAQLGDDLRYETSRGGDLFPHLYSTMPLAAVIRIDPLPLDGHGQHIFPELAE